MKKWKILIPSVLAIGTMPIVTLAACGEQKTKVYAIFNAGAHGQIVGERKIQTYIGTKWKDIPDKPTVEVTDDAYVFIGWTLNDEPVTDETEITGPATFLASYDYSDKKNTINFKSTDQYIHFVNPTKEFWVGYTTFGDIKEQGFPAKQAEYGYKWNNNYYHDSLCSWPWKDTDRISNNSTIYIKSQPDYSVTFNVMFALGDDPHATVSQTTKSYWVGYKTFVDIKDQLVTINADPGYKWDGYAYKDKGCQTQWVDTDPITEGSQIYLKAIKDISIVKRINFIVGSSGHLKLKPDYKIYWEGHVTFQEVKEQGLTEEVTADNGYLWDGKYYKDTTCTTEWTDAEVINDGANIYFNAEKNPEDIQTAHMMLGNESHGQLKSDSFEFWSGYGRFGEIKNDLTVWMEDYFTPEQGFVWDKKFYKNTDVLHHM